MRFPINVDEQLKIFIDDLDKSLLSFWSGGPVYSNYLESRSHGEYILSKAKQMRPKFNYSIRMTYKHDDGWCNVVGELPL